MVHRASTSLSTQSGWSLLNELLPNSCSSIFHLFPSEPFSARLVFTFAHYFSPTNWKPFSMPFWGPCSVVSSKHALSTSALQNPNFICFFGCRKDHIRLLASRWLLPPAFMHPVHVLLPPERWYYSELQNNGTLNVSWNSHSLHFWIFLEAEGDVCFTTLWTAPFQLKAHKPWRESECFYFGRRTKTSKGLQNCCKTEDSWITMKWNSKHLLFLNIYIVQVNPSRTSLCDLWSIVLNFVFSQITIIT